MINHDWDDYTDPDDSMSLQDLAVMRGHEPYDDEDLHDYNEEAYNEMLMNEGDF